MQCEKDKRRGCDQRSDTCTAGKYASGESSLCGGEALRDGLYRAGESAGLRHSQQEAQRNEGCETADKPVKTADQ